MSDRAPEANKLAQRVRAMYNTTRHRAFVRVLRISSSLVLPLAVAAGLYFLVRDSPHLLRSIRLDWWLLALSFVTACLGLVLAIRIWRHMLARMGVRASTRDDIRIYCYSALGYILPGGVWSILSRTGQYHLLGANALRVGAAGVIETLTIGVAAAVVYAIVMFFRPGTALWQRPELGFGLALLAVLAMHPRVFTSVAHWAFRRTRPEPVSEPLAKFGYGELLTWVALEAVVIFIGGLALYVLLNSLIPAPAALPQSLAAWASAAAASNLFFWLPGTPIIRDGVVVAALSVILPLPAALLFAGVLRAWTIMSLLLVAGVVWVLLDFFPRIGHNKHNNRFPR